MLNNLVTNEKKEERSERRRYELIIKCYNGIEWDGSDENLMRNGMTGRDT